MAHYVAVTGGRGFDDIDRVREAFRLVCAFYGDVRVLHGGALRGADRLAGVVADELGLVCKAFPADWTGPCGPTCYKGHRRVQGDRSICPAAGVRRNQHMVDLLSKWGRSHGVSVVAFPGGSGTADMIERCEAADLPVSTL